MEKIFIRPLTINDAYISYKWRNDAEIWAFTGKRPDKYITPEIEAEWLARVIKNYNDKRFAICLKANEQYIGNVQLLNIDNEEAEYHIFIGEKSQWGKGYAKDATILILKYAFNELKLRKVYLEVNPKNLKAINLYFSIGFRKTDLLPKTKDYLVMMIQSPLNII